MSKTTLKEELRALVAEIAEIDTVPDDASFKDLGIDSMMGVEIVAAIERQYRVKFDDDELQQFSTLSKSFEMVVQKLDAKPIAAAG